MILDTHTEQQELVEVLTDVDTGFVIILYNDDVNTFDHVITCLIKYCKHTPRASRTMRYACAF